MVSVKVSQGFKALNGEEFSSETIAFDLGHGSRSGGDIQSTKVKGSCR